MAEVFTLEAANALVPRLSTVVGRQLDRRAAIEERLRALASLTGDVPEEIVLDPNEPPPVRVLKEELLGRIEEYQRGWGEIEEMGGVLKDPRQGLVDFYGRVDDKLVWLCWKYGEGWVAADWKIWPSSIWPTPQALALPVVQASNLVSGWPRRVCRKRQTRPPPQGTLMPVAVAVQPLYPVWP